VAVQQPISTHWDRIVKFLDSLMDRLHKNFVSYPIQMFVVYTPNVQHSICKFRPRQLTVT